MMAAALVGIGIFYIAVISKYDSRIIKTFKYVMALLCLCTAVGMLLQAYKETFITIEKKPSAWLSDFDMGMRTALEKNKLLMVDFGAALGVHHVLQLKKDFLKMPKYFTHYPALY